MAKQEGIIKLTGRVGDLVLFKTKAGFSARLHTERDPEQFKNNPRMLAVRQNTVEFGQAGVIGKLIRTAFRQSIRLAKDPTLSRRMQTVCLRIIQSDIANERGERVFYEGDLSKLVGFEFNAESMLSDLLLFKPQFLVNREAKSIRFLIPALTTDLDIRFPKQATHVRFFASAITLTEELAELDDEAAAVTTGLAGFAESDLLPISSSEQPGFALEMQLNDMGNKPLAMALGVDFYTQDGTRIYPIRGSVFNACAIRHVEAVSGPLGN